MGICREPLTQKVRRKKRKQNKSEPTLYSYFEEVWGIRNRHMVKDLPHPYVFMLLPCKAKDRPHPRYEENGNSDDGNTWFPGSPPLSYFPIPIADPKRPWGSGACEQCGDISAGHSLSSSRRASRLLPDPWRRC